MLARSQGTGPLLVSGHVNVDRFLLVDRLPAPDRTVPIVSERTELGGTATIIARVARGAGVRVGLLSRVGDGFPAAFGATLRSTGLDLRGLERRAGSPTPTCTIVQASDGSSCTLIQQGPMADGVAGPLPGRWWRSYRWIHLGTGEPKRSLRLARAAVKDGIRVALDPAQETFYRWDRATFLSALGHAELLFGNRAEVERMADWAARGRPERLVDRVPLVVRTEGAGGATAFYRGGREHVPARRPRRQRSLVGAGDAFRGGFYGAWFAGAPLRESLEAGVRTATSWIEGHR